jgi:hypothetical protein
MKKTLFIKLLSVMAFVCLTVVLSQGATIYFDDFNRTGVLNGSTTTTGGGVWATNNISPTFTSLLETNGTILTTTSGAGNEVAYLSFTPQANSVYQLSMEYRSTSTSGNWVNFGFGAGTPPSAGGFPNDSTGWLLLYDQGGGSANTGFGYRTNFDLVSGSGFSTDMANFHTYTLELDTRPALWTYTVLVDNVQVGVTFAYPSVNPAITQVHIGAVAGITPQLNSFSLVQTVVPEPSTWAMLMLGCGVLALVALRRRAARA